MQPEDTSFMLTGNRSVDELRIPGMEDVCIVRSPVAHGRLLGLEIPRGCENQVFVAADLGLAFYERSDAPIGGDVFLTALATDRLRFAGQPIALCVGKTRGHAEDVARKVLLTFEELQPSVSAIGATPLVTDVADNTISVSGANVGDVDQASSEAAVRVTRQFKLNRKSATHFERRAILAFRDESCGRLVVYVSSQRMIEMRRDLAARLGLSERDVEIIALGGDLWSGGRTWPTPEEIAVCALALKRGTPVRWVEDESEYLLAAPQTGEYVYELTLFSTGDGVLLAIEGSVHVDCGAYPICSANSFEEAGFALEALIGPYRIRDARLRHFTSSSNKAPVVLDRSTAWTGARFAMERLIDILAHRIGVEPGFVRRKNLSLVTETPLGIVPRPRMSSGEPLASLELAAEKIDVVAVRRRQMVGERDGRRIGVGFAAYAEQRAREPMEVSAARYRVISSHETSTARMLPDGTAIVFIDNLGPGRGFEPALLDMAAHELRLDQSQITICQDETLISPLGFGAFASRDSVFVGGAVVKACRLLRERLRLIGSYLLETNPDDTSASAGAVYDASGRFVSYAEISQTAHRKNGKMLGGIDTSLEMTATYRSADPKMTSYCSTHAAIVAVDSETGHAEVLDYVIATDRWNGPDRDERLSASVIEGIGTALYKELPHDAAGRPTATIFDNHGLEAWELPTVRIAHLGPSLNLPHHSLSEGAIAAPAAIANALADAFRYSAAEFNEVPCTPRRITAVLDEAERRCAS